MPHIVSVILILKQDVVDNHNNKREKIGRNTQFINFINIARELFSPKDITKNS